MAQPRSPLSGVQAASDGAERTSRPLAAAGRLGLPGKEAVLLHRVFASGVSAHVSPSITVCLSINIMKYNT